MTSTDRKDWILPGLVLVGLVVGFGLLRWVGFGPPEDWSAADGPFPFKRMEAELERMKAARDGAPEDATPPAQWQLQGGLHLAWSRDGTLLAGARSGEAPAIARLEGDDVEVFAIPSLGRPEAGYAWHPQGLLLVAGRVGEGGQRLHTTAWTRRGAVVPVDLLDEADLPGDVRHPALSPDGGRVALVAADVGGERLVIWDRASGEVTPVAEGEALAHPTWSPEGDEVAWAARTGGQWDVLAGGPGVEPRVVAAGPGDQHLPAWGGDGTLLWVDGDELRAEGSAWRVGGVAPVRPAVAGPWVAASVFGRPQVYRISGSEALTLEGSAPLALALAERPGGLRVAWTASFASLTIRDLEVEP